ncbi:hypothetical protein EIP86_000304 [Pleurotus ostreatoroseus]|nr:hypothetical protein EIP86_000304 [Pleurotus ostreatoroseus]
MVGKKLLHLCAPEPTGEASVQPIRPVNESKPQPLMHRTPPVHEPFATKYEESLAQLTSNAAVPIWDERRLDRGLDIKPLYCSASQRVAIEAIHREGQLTQRIFLPTAISQKEAQDFLAEQRLDSASLEMLESRWSIQNTKTWTTRDGAKKRRTLYQCDNTNEKEWQRRAPYDHTECLAHAEITRQEGDGSEIVFRVVGYFEHNEACKTAIMKRFPSIPLHPRVYEIALQQLRRGAG